MIKEAKYEAEMTKYYNNRVCSTQVRVANLVLMNNEAS